MHAFECSKTKEVKKHTDLHRFLSIFSKKENENYN